VQRQYADVKLAWQRTVIRGISPPAMQGCVRAKSKCNVENQSEFLFCAGFDSALGSAAGGTPMTLNKKAASKNAGG